MSKVRLIAPRMHDLGGGMTVRRLLPQLQPQAVGPFLFFDHFGPLEVTPESQFDVRPHPHIGLATVTYLFEGAIMHRDSLGTEQRIEPGAINWMTAGRGIVHSERRPLDMKRATYRNHGLQLWAALPLRAEEADPAFFHTPADEIPVFASAGLSARVLIGAAFGLKSPVRTFQETLYLDLTLTANTAVELDVQATERALYGIDNAYVLDGTPVAAGTLAILEPQQRALVSAPSGARLVMIGGTPLDGYRHIWWNFVSSRRDRIERARADWVAQRMVSVGGDSERIPAPDL